MPNSASSEPLPKPVRYLSFASLFTDIASESVYPIMPIFLTSVLGASSASIGIIEGVAEATASLLKFFFGWWSDRVQKPKKMVAFGFALANFMKPVTALAQTWPQVLVIRFFDRVGKGIRTAPRDAWLASFASPENYPRLYGFHRGMDHLGAVLGPLLAAAFLFFCPGNYRLLFALTFIPGVIAVGFILRTPEQEKIKAPAKSTPLNPMQAWTELPQPLKKYFCLLLLFSLGNSSDAFLIVRLKDAGVTTPLIPLFWAALHIVKMSSSLWSHRFVKGFGTRNTILAGWILYAFVYFLFGLNLSRELILPTFCVYGLFFGLTEGPEKAFIATFSGKNSRGSAFGIYALALGIAAFPASFLLGGLWMLLGTKVAFWTGAAIALTAAVGLYSVLTPQEWKQEM